MKIRFTAKLFSVTLVYKDPLGMGSQERYEIPVPRVTIHLHF